MNMKKYGLLIAFLLVGIFSHADTYVIEELNGDYIIYNGKRLTKGDSFTEKDSIIWKNATAIHVRNTRTGNKERIREADFNPQKEFSPWKYFVKINHGSSRVCNDYCLCSILDNVFVLNDTIRLRTDAPEIIDVYLGKLSQDDLPDYYLSYRYNGTSYTEKLHLDGDELILTKNSFAHIPSSQTLSVAVFSIDKNGGRNNIANSMMIKIP